MTTLYVSPLYASAQQFFDNNGNVLGGGQIFTYVAGSTTPLPTYTDNTGTATNQNPILLDSTGRFTSGVWLYGGTAARYVVTTTSTVQVGPTYDYIPAIGDPAF
jgi:hypothetical protein